MIYQIASTNIDISPSMQELARQKFSKIEHYFEHVPADLQQVRIVMNTGQAVDTFEVGIELDLGTEHFYGKGVNYGLETALLDAVEDVKEQYLKEKAKSDSKDWEEARDAKRFDPAVADMDLAESVDKQINVACCIFYTASGQVLLEDRRKIQKHGEEWSFFGGSVEDGETIEEALAREIREELSYDLQNPTFFGKYSFMPQGKDFEVTYHVYTSLAPALDSLTVHSKGGIGVFSQQELQKLKMIDFDRNILNDFFDSKR